MKRRRERSLLILKRRQYKMNKKHSSYPELFPPLDTSPISSRPTNNPPIFV